MTLVSSQRRLSPELPSHIQGFRPLGDAASERTTPWDLRVVAGIREVLHEATEPAGLLAMGLGSVGFRAGRLFAQWGLFSGAGWGARLGASVFGVVTESLAINGTHRVYDHLTAHGQSLPASQWMKQWGLTALLMGSLRGSGAGALGLGHFLHGDKVFSSKILFPLYQQAGMLGGILLGHGLTEDFHSPEEHLKNSLGCLLKFNLGGIFAARTTGRFFQPLERRIEMKSLQLEAQRNDGSTGDLAIAGIGGKFSSSKVQDEGGIQILQIQGNKPSGTAPSFPYQPTVMGIASTPEGEALANFSATVRLAQEGEIKELTQNRKPMDQNVAENPWLSEFLSAHEIPAHPFDLKMFRAGYSLGKENQELVRSIAWDVDEVQLHWSLNTVDLFRGIFRGEKDAPHQNTPHELFDYHSFKTSPGVNLPLSQRLWYKGVQRFAPSRMRQTVQFHPGSRAYLLGMASALYRPLNLVTTGPAGRLLILINEDPALKKIYFNKLPTEPVTIEEIRRAANVYTREDLVKAMRILAEAKEDLLHDSLVRDYLGRIKKFPKQGHKLKHPALAKILEKNSFHILVDDSQSTYRMLGDLPGFTVLKPASARPNVLLNFSLGSRRSYLNRMGNGSFEELARILDQEQGRHSRGVPAGNLPKDYPLQRFAIEVPWSRFQDEFALPGAELDQLSKSLANKEIPPSEKYSTPTLGFDYQGKYLRPGRRVAMLGDVGARRTYQLAKEGHYPIFIDIDSTIWRRLFRRFNEQEIRLKEFNRQVLVKWVEENWYTTSTNAHAVEAYYPHSMAAFIGRSEEATQNFVKNFMEKAVHTKLGPDGGTVYLVSEVRALVEMVSKRVEEDPSLNLIEMDLTSPSPIQGGYDFMDKPGFDPVSWILYVKKPE